MATVEDGEIIVICTVFTGFTASKYSENTLITPFLTVAINLKNDIYLVF
ncbi:hypothetical protein [Gloeothece verrucosa]|nr:hypothetical protein [Gloeothece verrucosa]